MDYIRKYCDGWAIHNDDNGKSRLLNDQEVKAVKREFPKLEDEKVRTVLPMKLSRLKRSHKRFSFFFQLKRKDTRLPGQSRIAIFKLRAIGFALFFEKGACGP